MSYRKASRCNSQLGMVGGVQYLNLDINGCRWALCMNFMSNLGERFLTARFLTKNLAKIII
ncbi:hypothetical protein KUTeg_011981 [Tegillarca granosa]|uniref:Uncharacterized protein n=1 Tax=Tegillarca granosa TaxID=220873 RepID=A0ABQ9EY71_TEGGR|nr:hypothetical protein KUTeg_011981 [Tegillarca granosa]